MSELDSELQKMVAQHEIADVIYRYCSAADRLDIDLFKSVFWEDGRYEGGPVAGPAHEFAAALVGDVVRNLCAYTMHKVGNIRVHLDGDSARSESYLTATHISHPTRASRIALIGADAESRSGFNDDAVIEFILNLRYVDDFERRKGEWRISTRRLIPEWNRFGLYNGISHGGILDICSNRGSRDRNDPSY